MRLAALALSALIAVPALAEAYSFRLSVGEARAAQREQGVPETAPEGTRALILDRTNGTRFKWLMLECPHGDAVQWSINKRGGVGSDRSEDADLVLAPHESGTVTTRCMRASCVIHVTSGDDRRADFALTKGQSAEIPLGDWDVELEP